MRHHAHGRRGFSLAEMVAALAIFSIGVTGTLSVFAVCLRSTATSAAHTRAVFLAQGLMEQVLADDEFGTGDQDGEFGEAFPGAWWTRRVEETDVSDLYEVRVEVSWPVGADARSVELISLVARR